MLVSSGGAQNCASKLRVTILLRDPLTIPAYNRLFMLLLLGSEPTQQKAYIIIKREVRTVQGQDEDVGPEHQLQCMELLPHLTSPAAHISHNTFSTLVNGRSI